MHRIFMIKSVFLLFFLTTALFWACQQYSNQTNLTITSITLSANGQSGSFTLSGNAPQQLVATVTYADGTQRVPNPCLLTWTSSNPVVAKVNSCGMVTGVTPGVATTTITATLYGAVSSGLTITVSINNTWVGVASTSNTDANIAAAHTGVLQQPGGRNQAMSWTDRSGNLWLFGGYIPDNPQGASLSTSLVISQNDLWECTPVGLGTPANLLTCPFTAVTGADFIPAYSNSATPVGVGGTYPNSFTQGIQGTGIPPSRVAGSTWTDTNGNLWLFGGLVCNSASAAPTGSSCNNPLLILNDLWYYTPSLGLWTYVSGSTPASSSLNLAGGQYPPPSGSSCTPSATCTPGARQLAARWTDSQGNFWLYGGIGCNGSSSTCTISSNRLNDLWCYTPATSTGNGCPTTSTASGFANPNTWTWLSGSSTSSTLRANYPSFGGSCAATIGTTAGSGPGTTCTPGGRDLATTWITTDSTGDNLWLFGGTITDSNGTTATYSNDLWKYNINSATWTWVSGSDRSGTTANTLAQLPPVGVGNSCTPGLSGHTPTCSPAGRDYPLSWTDNNGNLWLFGGSGCSTTLCGTAAAPLDLNDLWMYNVSANQWTWVAGSTTGVRVTLTPAYSGTYGSQGIGAASNIPGVRQNAVGWKDAQGNFWLFSGSGENQGNGSSTVGGSITQNVFMSDLWQISAP